MQKNKRQAFTLQTIYTLVKKGPPIYTLVKKTPMAQNTTMVPQGSTIYDLLAEVNLTIN